MSDTNEQLKKLFAPYEQVDIVKLNTRNYEIDRDHPIYWVCVDNNGDLCCGKSTLISQVNLILASNVKDILFFKRREK